jgi:hypothetical protein
MVYNTAFRVLFKSTYTKSAFLTIQGDFYDFRINYAINAGNQPNDIISRAQSI